VTNGAKPPHRHDLSTARLIGGRSMPSERHGLVRYGRLVVVAEASCVSRLLATPLRRRPTPLKSSIAGVRQVLPRICAFSVQVEESIG
jgi:hypothetical protein